MSVCDPYRELELYLKQAENEITKVFEKTHCQQEQQQEQEQQPQQQQQQKQQHQNKEDVNNTTNELDPFLLNFDASIKSDLSELLSRYGLKNDHFYDDDDLKRELFLDDLILDSTSIINPINAATQTSPSLSPSSLTWASECSSSPCLTTSTSDSDLVDDDSSSSSIETRDRRWQQVLSTKSSSAPVLKKIPIKVSKQARSQSDRHLAEIEAAEACKWLRATGFPQYAQMYENQQFPVDVSTAAQDHPLLEPDVLNSLFRRLQILNNCVHLQHLAHHHNQHHVDESEDEYCALSDNWIYQTDIRRWSRTCNEIFETPTIKDNHHHHHQKLRRAGSTKLRRRRDGIVISDSGSKIFNAISQHLNDLKPNEIKPVSDSECTPTHRKSRITTFETWSHPHNERVLDKPEENSRDTECPSIFSLSCPQLQVLRKLALLKLTAHMEKYCPSHRTGWNWDLPKFIRKMNKTPIYKDKTVFGVPITITLQKTGRSLPKNIEIALEWLQKNALDQVGIFRKPGVKSRIQFLKNLVETNENEINFDDQQAYDVADMVKQYFRDLPDTLLTNKLSETFILIFQHVPPFLRRESVLCAILLMPEEHVEVLQTLLNFLLSISKHSSINQMNESNLATCFAPSLIHYSQVSTSSSNKQNLGIPHPKELAENKAGQECLLYFLKNSSSLFKIPKEFLNQCKSIEFKESTAVSLCELGKDMGGDWREYLKECQVALLREAKEKGRGWMVINGHNSKVEISYKKVADGHPLRLWKISTEIEAPPSEVLHRLLRERHIWDPELKYSKIISQIDKNVEIFQILRNNLPSKPYEEYCILRCWKSDLPKDSCLIVETSVEYNDCYLPSNSVRGIVLASRYLIEPCGSGKSRLLHLSRIDTKGRTPEWYQKNYGHISALFIANIMQSFYQTAMGPESKV